MIVEAEAPPRSVVDTRLEDAWAGMESAPTDEEWVEWFMIWLELHRLKFGPDLEEGKTN